MRLIRTERFKRAYRKLENQEQERAKQALVRLLADRTYPALRAKRVQGTAKIWELRASRDIRVTFEIEDNTIILRNVGHHDPTLKNP